MKQVRRFSILILTLLLILEITGCSNWRRQPVGIIDAYCAPNYSPTFLFRFTLNNSENKEIDISYSWTLNDPMADLSGFQKGVNNLQARMYEGEGKTSIPAKGEKNIEIQIDQTGKFGKNLPAGATFITGPDPRGWVMYIYIYQNNTQIAYYREQKSTFDWDYSHLPPVKRAEKWTYSQALIDTFIERTVEGYKANIEDIIVMPPHEIADLSLNNIRVSVGDQSLVLSDLITSSSGNYDLKYYDVDGDKTVSKGDFLTMNQLAKGLSLSFSSWNNPFTKINRMGVINIPEKVDEESSNAIRIIDLKYNPVKSEVEGRHLVEFYAEVSSDKSLRPVNYWFTALNGNGHLENPEVQANISVYHQTLEYIYEPGYHIPNYLVLFFTDDTNEVIRVIGPLN